ncbi:hypothetical protein T4D_15125 [Trichinella pseudospiralis]|uniref:Uncharacterized protein n=1 Tax=Trichinella pseudospiralis TaxID=6337 RepID=A0A0V1FY55_TRIPS|nr:hypothetical protein T4D_15125 [Trichinella pseudospiralis]
MVEMNNSFRQVENLKKRGRLNFSPRVRSYYYYYSYSYSYSDIGAALSSVATSLPVYTLYTVLEL